MRLIDADALIDQLGVSDEDIKFKYTLEDAPTVDAAPVVRCGECRKYHTPDCHAVHEQASADYCSHGIRKG